MTEVGVGGWGGLPVEKEGKIFSNGNTAASSSLTKTHTAAGCKEWSKNTLLDNKMIKMKLC